MTEEAIRRASCARVRGRLARAFDGGLAPLEEALDRGHLEACEGCQRERERHVRLLAGIRAVSAGDELEVERVTSAVLARLGPPVRTARRFSPRTLVAAAAALILVSFLALGGAEASPRPVDLGAFDRVLEGLPGWSDVLRGLESLSRRLS